MLKTLKYEFRRGAFSLMVMALIIAAIELYFVISLLLKSEEHTVISVMLLLFAAFGCYIYVLIHGIVIYSNDLKNKYGYLIFMTPVSSYKIIGAKLLSILLTGIGFVLLIGVCIVIDSKIIQSTYGYTVSLIDSFNLILNLYDLSVGGLLARLLAFILVMLVAFFMTITLAYLAVSICSTGFQSKKYKGFLSFVLFIAMYVFITIFADQLPTLGDFGADATFLQQIYSALPRYLLYVVVIIGSYLGSATLLDKKISL